MLFDMNIGKKTKQWNNDKKLLIKEFESKGITRCELCGSTFGLSFHHIVRRSKGGSNTSENIVLLCIDCHHKADNASGYVEFNNSLKRLRNPLQNY